MSDKGHITRFADATGADSASAAPGPSSVRCAGAGVATSAVGPSGVRCAGADGASATPDPSDMGRAGTDGASGTASVSNVTSAPKMRDAAPPTLPHPRMPLSQRAKIFIPFDPLKGYQEALQEKEREAEARMNERVRIDDPA